MLLSFFFSVRGYQYSSGPNAKKRNPPAFRAKLDQPQSVQGGMADALAEAVAPDADSDAAELKQHGLGKPAG